MKIYSIIPNLFTAAQKGCPLAVENELSLQANLKAGAPSPEPRAARGPAHRILLQVLQPPSPTGLL